MSTQTLEQKPAHSQPFTSQKEVKPEETRSSTNKSQTSKTRSSKKIDHKSTLETWISMPRSELDEIYKRAKPGSIPQGSTRGTAILGGGTMPRIFSKAARALAWQGKIFDLFSPNFNSGVVVNKILPVGLHSIVAKTYRGQSWMDGKDTIIIDYSDTSLFARQIRDEIREVEPGLYLGKVWWGKTRVLDFALETHDTDNTNSSKKTQ